MRLTPTTALQYASSTATTASTASLPWLQNLKLPQLQRIAQATGIQSSGPKGPLIRRLEREIAPCEAPMHGHGHGHGPGPMSILSIDMGIRNLAFAHLTVPSFSPSSSSSSSASSTGGVLDDEKSTDLDRGVNVTPRLNAWRRLAISDLDLLPCPLSGSGSQSQSQSQSESHLPGEGMDQPPTGTQPDDIGAQALAQEAEKEKENFSPARYAPLAYGLITSLLERYRPTHVLIERQRFRTGGGSAVQEWTLRVGVFEGMLYAVLFALREGYRLDRCLGMAPVVVGVEPQRVVRFWGGQDVHGVGTGGLGAMQEKGKKSAAVTAREGKKVKIDLVGRWLDRGVASSSSSSLPPDSAAGGDVPLFGSRCDRVMVGEDPEVRRWVEGYLTRWKGKKKKKSQGRKPTHTETDETVEIGKLDDLADCLLQGVTWLEWQVMRERLMREGIDALEG